MIGFNLKEFKNPSAIYRPVPFYSWNEWMEPDEIRRQIDEIISAGWGGIFIHSRIGLTTPYLGEEWFEAVEATIEYAKERGIKVWLYDEDKWPSGYSGGTVPLANKEYRQKALIARPDDLPPPPDCVKIGEQRNGLQCYVWTAPLGHNWFNGTCYADLMNRDAMEKFTEDAYESYYQRFGEEYGAAIVGEFTDEPAAIFRIRLPHGAVPYSPELLSRFHERWGYDPVPRLHLLYQNSDDAPEFRLHYFRIINELFEQNFSRLLGDWCEDHGIALTGHYMLEDSLYGQQTWGVKIMPNYRHQEIPGVDHLGRHVNNLITLKQCQSVVNQHDKPRMLSELYGVAGGSLTFLDRAWIGFQQICLGVNLLNPHLSLYTMSGCRKRDYPQNIFYQQPWWPLNSILDTPLSRLCASLTQGKCHAEFLLIHPGESSFVHWETELDEKKFDGLLGWNHEPTTPRAKEIIDRIDRQFTEVIETLLGEQRTFDLGDETILAEEGSVATSDNRPVIRIGKMDYPVVILPTMTTMAESTFRMLTDFLDAGGTVIQCGEPAPQLEGRTSPRLREFFARIKVVNPEQLPVVLRKIASPPVVGTPELKNEDKRKLYIHARDLPNDDRLVFLVNLNRFRTFTSKLRFTGPFKSVQHLNIHSGEPKTMQARCESDGLYVTLPFSPAQGHLLLLSKEAPAGQGHSLLPSEEKQFINLPADRWTVERYDDNAITLDYAFWCLGKGSFSQKPSPVIGVQEYLNSCAYDGPLTLRYPVKVHSLAPGRKVHVVVEHPEYYTIRINGKAIEPKTLPFWLDFRWRPIDITGLLEPDRENIIELHCEDFQHGDLNSIDDLPARYGTEIEAIYLVGDFSVSGRVTESPELHEHWSEYGLPPIGIRGFETDSFVLEEPIRLNWGDTTSQGLPFYAGRIGYTTQLPAVSAAGRWFLRIQNLDCPIAEVKIDGKTIGHFMLEPFEIELTGYLDGTPASLEIVLYSTLRNLLGPHHNPHGEMAAVGPEHFTAIPCLDDNGINQWVFRHQNGDTIPQWTDSYCMVAFGDLGRVTLIDR